MPRTRQITCRAARYEKSSNSRGRHFYLPEFKLWIVEQALTPGMSVAALAMTSCCGRLNGLDSRLFLKRSSHERCDDLANRFINCKLSLIEATAMVWQIVSP